MDVLCCLLFSSIQWDKLLSTVWNAEFVYKNINTTVSTLPLHTKKYVVLFMCSLQSQMTSWGPLFTRR